MVKQEKQSLIEETTPPENNFGGVYHPKNSVNNLTGKEWLFFTKSVIRTSYPSEYGHKIRKKHYANKPPQLMKLIIEFFTKQGESVLDPFCGVGGTLIGASLSKRKAVGIEINNEWLEIYKEVCQKERILLQDVHQGDCYDIMSSMVDDGVLFDSIVTDPPYSPALEKTICDEKYGWANRKSNFSNFSNEHKDLRNLKTFEEYYDEMQKRGKLMYNLLKNGKYLALMIRDSYQKGEYIPASFYIAERYKEVGFVFKGIKIWYSTGAPVRPYGYPYSYVPNIVHHNILIFKKEER